MQKNILKRTLALVLCICVTISMFTMLMGTTVFAAVQPPVVESLNTNDSDYTVATSGTSGETTWRLDNGTLYIEGSGAMANYANVGDIAPWKCFYSEITSIVIGDEVTYVGNRAFKGLNKATYAIIGSSVETVGYECFYGCTSLVDIEVKTDILTSIGSLCFYKCAFESFDIPATVTTLANRAFKECKNLTSIAMPNAVTTTGYEVFMGCASLETATISTSLNMINPLVFQDCVSLKSVYVPANIIRVRTSAFANCTALEIIEFENDDNLIASSTGDAAIASNAFSGCTNLTLKSTMHGTVNDYAVRKNIAFVANNTSIFKYSLDDNNNATITGMRGSSIAATIPETVDGYTVIAIGYAAFRDNTNLSRVVIPSTVKTIEGRAFQGCTALALVEGLENVSSLAYSAFQNCSALISVNFSKELTAINANTFNGCTALNEIYVPNTITTVNNSAFTGCTNAIIKTQENSAAAKFATAQNIDVKIVTDFDYVINEDGQTATVTGYLGNGGDLEIPTTINGYTITEIGYSAFRNVIDITSVTLPYTITKIGGRAFQNCTGLTSVVIPQGVLVIDYNAFDSCTNLTEVVFWDIPSTIHNLAFNGCENLTFYGSAGTIIETFANKKGFDFVEGRKFATYELPVININTEGQAITSREDYVNMTFSMENCEDELINVTGGIRLRGNSTSHFPKKPYRIKFDKKQSLFGLEKAKSWVLLAEYIDASGLNNYTAYNLASQMPGLEFSPTPHKVNVYLNGEFLGMYTLCEQIQENPGRVNIEMEDDITESMVDLEDYNFLICMDESVVSDDTAILDETYYYIPEYDSYFEIKYPEKGDFPTEELFESFLSQLKDYTKDILDTFSSRDIDKIKAKCHIESLVDFLIVDQIMGEIDHRSKSFYMYYTSTSSDPDRNNKLNFGPVWDYDFALYVNFTGKPNLDYQVSNKIQYSNMFYQAIVEIPEIYEMIADRYEQYALPALTEYLENFDDLAASIEESTALNNELWYEDTYGTEISKNNVAFLKAFLINRIKVLNKAWLGIE